jgi:hypothetical protein
MKLGEDNGIPKSILRVSEFGNFVLHSLGINCSEKLKKSNIQPSDGMGILHLLIL